MKLTERQKFLLLTIALDSCRIEHGVFGSSREIRQKLCEEIVNQQESELDENQVVCVPCSTE